MNNYLGTASFLPSHLFFRNIFQKLLTKSYLYDILVKQFTLQHSDGRIMFEKNMKIAYLLDFYGDALDDHVSTVMRAYYNEDLSLAEIADDVGISRQGVRHLIKKGEELIEFYEAKFALAARHTELTEVCKSLTEIGERIANSDTTSADAQELSRIVGIILKGN